tara:strand:+ start:1068 stop:1421 length:354 start_codon:yes stop_codon:yes gene_type:complete
MKKRVRKRTVKRKVTKKRTSKKQTKKKSALSGALKDLEREIRTLNKEKAELKRSSSSTSTMLDMTRQQERALQQRIARIIEKQARLNQRKKSLQVKIDRDADKINKISKIRSEISDI